MGASLRQRGPRDLAALIAHLDLGPVHMTGQDISGRTTFRVAATHPEPRSQLHGDRDRPARGSVSRRSIADDVIPTGFAGASPLALVGADGGGEDPGVPAAEEAFVRRPLPSRLGRRSTAMRALSSPGRLYLHRGRPSPGTTSSVAPGMWAATLACASAPPARRGRARL